MSTITRPHAETARSTAATYDPLFGKSRRLLNMRNKHPPPGTINGITGVSHVPHPLRQ